MRQILTLIWNFFASTSPAVHAVWAVGTLFLAFNAYINTLWVALFVQVDDLVASGLVSPTANFSPLGLLNYCFPLDTLCSFLSAYLVLRATCAGIRIIKSFIPGLT